MTAKEVVLADAVGEDFFPDDTAVPERLANIAHLYPDRIALVSAHQPADLLSLDTDSTNTSATYLRWTYLQLQERARRLAVVLSTFGVEAGMPFVCVLGNRAEFAVALWTAFTMRCPFAPLNPKAASNAKEFEYILGLLQPTVIIVEDEALAAQLDTSLQSIISKIPIKIVAGGEREPHSLDGWLELRQLISATASPLAGLGHLVKPDLGRDDVQLILFTSGKGFSHSAGASDVDLPTLKGTTSMPKGCVYTSKTYSASLSILTSMSRPGVHEVRCGVLPIYHSGGLNQCVSIWVTGSTLCFPSAFFDPKLTLKVIEAERCTLITAVPTIVAALNQCLSSEPCDTSSLELVTLGGTMVFPHTVRACKEGLKAKRVATAFGLTEAVPILGSFSKEPAEVGGRIVTGKVVLGTKVKLCAPGSQSPVARGEPGEVHVAGPQVFDGYLGLDNGSIYVEDGIRWLKTGDQAVMDQAGNFSISGRYKDMIIRAGRNISPVTIEDILDAATGTVSQVVGVPDELAGEVPVAIVERLDPSSHTKRELLDRVRSKVGKSNVPAHIFTLTELSLAQWPRGYAGKIRKVDLKEVVRKHLNLPLTNGPANDASSITNGFANGDSSLTCSVRQLWSSVLNIPIERLSRSSNIHGYADSINIMHFVNMVSKELGKKITYNDILEHGTVEEQVHLLTNKSRLGVPVFSRYPLSKESPLTADNIVSTLGDPDRFKQIQNSTYGLLSRLRLSWSDLEDIVPMDDWARNNTTDVRDQGSNMRFIFRAKTASPDQVKAAIEGALSHHAVLRTLAIIDDRLGHHYVVVRPTRHWFDQCIKIWPSAEPVDTFRDFARDEEWLFANVKTPLFKALIVPMQGDQGTGFIVQAHHSTYDSFTLKYFFEDIGRILRGLDTVPRMSPKIWCETTYLGRHSTSCQMSVDFHVRRLTGIADHQSAFWPPQLTQGWWPGSDIGCTAGKRPPLDDPDELREFNPISCSHGLSRAIALKHLMRLRIEHQVQDAITFKAAMAILTTQLTGQSRSIFSQLEARRTTWPFVPDFVAEHLPDPSDTCGPTAGGIVANIHVDPEESVLAFLKSLQSEQKLIAKHVHAPIYDICEKLSKEDATAVLDNAHRNLWDWLPVSSFDDSMNELESVGVETQFDYGITWLVGKLGSRDDGSEDEHFKVGVVWDVANLRLRQMREALELYMLIVQLIAEPANWERKIGDLRAALA